MAHSVKQGRASQSLSSKGKQASHLVYNQYLFLLLGLSPELPPPGEGEAQHDKGEDDAQQPGGDPEDEVVHQGRVVGVASEDDGFRENIPSN